LRYRRSGHLHGPLTRLLLAGTVPGVIVGAVIRVPAARPTGVPRRGRARAARPRPLADRADNLARNGTTDDNPSCGNADPRRWRRRRHLWDRRWLDPQPDSGRVGHGSGRRRTCCPRVDLRHVNHRSGHLRGARAVHTGPDRPRLAHRDRLWRRRSPGRLPRALSAIPCTHRVRHRRCERPGAPQSPLRCLHAGDARTAPARSLGTEPYITTRVAGMHARSSA
jgi:hypothetical protein